MKKKSKELKVPNMVTAKPELYTDHTKSEAEFIGFANLVGKVNVTLLIEGFIKSVGKNNDPT